MKISVIGVGAIGGTIARRLSARGHEVRVANSRGPEAMKDFARQIGAEPTDVTGAVEGADAVILSIPFPAVRDLPNGLFSGVPDQVPVIDTGNYYPGMRDPQIPGIDAGQSESMWVSEQLGRPIVKAFNNIMAHSLDTLGKPQGDAGRLALPVAGDDEGHKNIAMELVDEMGFDPVDGGSLEESWRQQPGTPAYCCDYGAEDVKKGIAAAVKEEAPRKRDIMMTRWSELLPPDATHQDIVALQRRLNAVG